MQFSALAADAAAHRVIAAVIVLRNIAPASKRAHASTLSPCRGIVFNQIRCGIGAGLITRIEDTPHFLQGIRLSPIARQSLNLPMAKARGF